MTVVMTGIDPTLDTPRQFNVVVGAPRGAGTDQLGDNYRITDNESNLPLISTANLRVSGRFDDITYYTAIPTG